MSKVAQDKNQNQAITNIGYSRRRFIRFAALSTTLVPIMGTLLAACGQATTTSSSPTSTTALPSPTSSNANATTSAASLTTPTGSAANILKSPLPGVPDGYLAPPPSFKATSGVPGKGGTVKVYLIAYFTPPPPRNENKFWQELEKRLGVTWDVTLAPQTSYGEKLAIMGAGGDLPDLTFIDLSFASDQSKLIEQGVYTDLTSFLTGDALKEYPNLAAYPPQIWKNMAIRGKVYGVPRPRFLSGSISLWRKDWAEKMGNPNPKNATEFYKLLEDFTSKKAEESQAKTWGMGFTQNEFAQQSLFMYMFRVPNNWRLESNGNFTYYIETPEYREAVAFMRRLWEAGLIYPGSVSQNKQQAADNFVAGKYGVFQDNLTGIPGVKGRRVAAQKVNPKADVVAFIPPGYDGGKPATWLTGGYFGFAAIPAKIGKNTEKTRELLNILNYLASPFGSEEYNFLNFGIDKVHNEVKADGTRLLNELGNKEISELPRIANGAQVLYYPGYEDHVTIVQDGIRRYIEAGISNPSQGAVSSTWNSKNGELNLLVEERITQIVIGRDPLSALDDIISEWKKRGGTQAASEFANSLKA